MGMPVTVQVVDAEADEQALDEVFNEFRLLDRTFSPFLVDSEVSRINRGELRPENAGQLVNQAINLCHLYEQATERYFSAWIGGRFDPSGAGQSTAPAQSSTVTASATTSLTPAATSRPVAETRTGAHGASV